jgi:hypothetical protein
LTLLLNSDKTDSAFSKTSRKFSICCLLSLPLQEEEFHCVSLLMLVRLDWINVFYDFWWNMALKINMRGLDRERKVNFESAHLIIFSPRIYGITIWSKIALTRIPVPDVTADEIPI